MAITKTERVILLNQFRMLAKLDPDEKDSYNRHAKALEYGFTNNYDFLENLSPELSQDDCRLVLQALDLHEAMQTSWAALADKGGIKAQQITYRGFDGNNETQHMSYSQFIVEDSNVSPTWESGTITRIWK